MTGLCFWGIFSTSLWPADEPPLPGRIHIWRARGGPIASIALGALTLLLALLLGQSAGQAWWLAVCWRQVTQILALTPRRAGAAAP